MKFLIMTLVASLALANPVPQDDTISITPCATVRCAFGPCTVVDNQAVCPPAPCSTVKCAFGPCKVVDLKPVCPTEPPIADAIPCGENICGRGQYCCNASCGTCAFIGGACTKQFCPPKLEGPKCGPKQCAEGEVCCNSSCGHCTKPGGFCTQEVCPAVE